MYSLIRIRYFISVAAWLIPVIIHFLCGSQLQVLKCVSISIRCLLLLDINTCFWLSLEMFYFGCNAAALKNCGGICSYLYFRHKRMRRWRVMGILVLLMAPLNSKGWYPCWCQGLFPGPTSESMGAASGQQRPTVPMRGSVGWGSPTAPHHIAR